MNVKNRFPGIAMGAALLTAAVFAQADTAVAANAAPPVPNGVYTIAARHSGKCLDVSGANPNKGANVIQWDCTGGNNQKWNVVSRGGDFYVLTALHSNKCLDVNRADRANGANVQQWDCTGGDNQTWRITAEGGNVFQLTARHSGKVLDVAGNNRAAGANVAQWDNHKGDNQRWIFTPATITAPGKTTTTQPVRTTSSSPQVVQGGQTQPQVVQGGQSQLPVVVEQPSIPVVLIDDPKPVVTTDPKTSQTKLGSNPVEQITSIRVLPKDPIVLKVRNSGGYVANFHGYSYCRVGVPIDTFNSGNIPVGTTREISFSPNGGDGCVTNKIHLVINYLAWDFKWKNLFDGEVGVSPGDTVYATSTGTTSIFKGPDWNQDPF